MEFLEILSIAVGLAMDAFAVSIGIGTTRFALGRRPVFRLSFHFGLFQCLMPILGWLAGAGIAGWLDGYDHWIAAGLLAFVGARMVRSGLSPDASAFEGDPSRGRTLLFLCFATSIDALAVGLSVAMLGINIIYPSIVIGIVTSGLSLVGLGIGHKLGELFGKRMEIVGGLILFGIGLHVLVPGLG
jgi:putative Mn2+ efflux pump MntP